MVDMSHTNNNTSSSKSDLLILSKSKARPYKEKVKQKCGYLSVLQSIQYPNRNSNSNSWCDQTITLSDKSYLRGRAQSKPNAGGIMSDEELKIRSELEVDIERDLEEEIKDGIFHLALRLHRLYRHQKERNATEVSEFSRENQRGTKKKKTLSEVNINIKMEGGTKIEFKEIKKEAPESKGRPQTSSRSENTQGMMARDTKKFDWVKTLRSGAGPVAINKKNERSHQGRKQSNVGSTPHHNNDNSSRRNCTSSLGQRKENVRVESKLLAPRWKC
ncbi:hypothetical protein L1049_024334 [Liquidambar formosana]|uniref:Uncharacterized protein n=1 Tax=Liquidambar formosana TaxID=63359 RepID=A0AAP0RVX6_LIQFO